MSKRYPFCSVAELQQVGRITRFVDELRDEISAFHIDQSYRVMSTICPHLGGDFDYDRSQCTLRCRWHGLKFNARTGQSLTDMAEYGRDAAMGTVLGKKCREPLGVYPYKITLTEYAYQIEGDTLELVIP